MAHSMLLTAGSLFGGDYRIERPLAEGGMGAVYVATQLSTGQQRALKVMQPQLVADEKSRVRFLEEARIGSRIASDHVVSVVAAGVDPTMGMPWLAMELLEGVDLDRYVRERGPLPHAEVIDLLEQAAHALADAHAKGIIHRDLKPENLFVAQSRRRNADAMVKILDFGIARTIAESRVAATVTSAIGSPLWMAPEQAQAGAKLRPATDVWALGLIAFYMLSGRQYWLSANHEEFNLSALLVEVMTQPIAAPSQRAAQLGVQIQLPFAFDAWFMRCLARDPEQRFAEAGAAIRDLRQVLSGAYAVTAPAPLARQGTQPLPSASSTSPVTPATQAVSQPIDPPTRGGINGLAVAAIAVVVIGLVGAVATAIVVTSGDDEQERPAPSARTQVGRELVVEEPAPLVVEPPPPPPEVVPVEPAQPENVVEPAREPPAPGDVPREVVERVVRPQVSIGAPDVRGNLSREVIERVMRRHQNEIRACYERALVQRGDLAGRVGMSFIITQSGEVQSSSVADSTLNDASLESCMSQAVRRWTFPPPDGGSVVTVNVRFTLQAVSEERPASVRRAQPAPRPPGYRLDPY